MSSQAEQSMFPYSQSAGGLLDSGRDIPLVEVLGQQPGDGTEEREQRVSVTQGPRLYFVDNVRVLLIILVIMHHLAITYGAAGSWYYYDPTKNALTGALLTVLTATDQAFFMGFFFLISAYFTPGSYDRKQAGPFLRDKFFRLGIPLLIYDILIDPLVNFIATGSHRTYWHFYVGYALYLFSLGKVIGLGSSWFIEALFFFVIMYALWRVWNGRRAGKTSTALSINTPCPTYRSMLLYIVGLALVDFLLRIWFPIGWSIHLLNFQIAFFPQYISMFILGIVAYRAHWFTRIPDSMGRVWGWVAIVDLLLFPIMAIGGGVTQHIGYFEGGLHWQALAFDFWEAIMCVAMCTSLLILFRKRLNRQGRLSAFLSANAYTVYIIFPLVIVSLAYSLHTVALFPLLKYGLAVVIAVPGCFGLSALVRMLPHAKKIL